MIIRPETPADYAEIARLLVSAFHEQMAEAVLVALLRQRAAYTPALALVAEIDGAIAGHALFTPCTLQLMGEDVPAVLLAPLAVDTALQKRGIGTLLLEEGHRLAREGGAAVSLLLGHPSYYPRFGYQMQAFGTSTLQVDVHTLRPASPLESLRLTEADVPMLMKLWEYEEAQVDFAFRPEVQLADWLSPNPQVAVTVYKRDGLIVGCTRIRQAEPAAPRFFLAADDDAAHTIAAHIAAAAGVTTVTLPLHPGCRSASTLGHARVETFDPAMALSLKPSPFDRYLAEVRAGQRLHGRPIWPPAFDLA
ncbi:MAG TPA: N-acetyltransferase [Candidatus Limnocylindrales bacterium]|nr:N-acetyltransferase [Candidatus Limnocylindrales bacterium]